MILIITNKEDLTADYLIIELLRRSAPHFRLNTEDFPSRTRLSWSIGPAGISAVIETPGGQASSSEFRSILYRRPKPPTRLVAAFSPWLHSFVREESNAAIQGFWRSLDCFWVSKPDSIAKAESKLFQLKKARSLGFKVPDTIVTNDPESARAFCEEHEWNLVYKALRTGRVNSDSGPRWIFTSPISQQNRRQIDRVANSPVLLQARYDKISDIRVTVVGNRVFAVEIHSQEHPEAREDWRRVDAANLRHTSYELPSELEMACRELVRDLDLQFGAIDLIRDREGKHVFLEINPNGQWAWIQQICPEIEIREAMADLLESR